MPDTTSWKCASEYNAQEMARAAFVRFNQGGKDLLNDYPGLSTISLASSIASDSSRWVPVSRARPPSL
jgi:hypothetical protein